MFLKIRSPPSKKTEETLDPKKAEKLKKEGYSCRVQKSGKFILTKKLAKWEIFEEKVRIFLEALNFKDVDSGQGSWLSRYQIDACGGYEKTFLVIECKSSENPKLKKLINEINTFSGKKAEIESAIKEKFGNKYAQVKYVLAIDDIEISDKDKISAKENDIYIWGSNYIKTGHELYSILGELAIHYVLKELEIGSLKIKDDDDASDYVVPSFRITYGETKLYSFFISAEKMLKLAYVLRLQPINEDAYQRFISVPRLKGSEDEEGITPFINRGGFFKNNVVCSFSEPVKFKNLRTGLLDKDEQVELGLLHIPKIYGSIWVIDGQHRIYGFARADPDAQKRNIGVVAYEDVQKKQQARDFMDINQKQKSIDPNTIWDLLCQTDPASLEGAITRLAKHLNKEGLFKGKIWIPGIQYSAKKSNFSFKLANVCNTIYDRKMLDKDQRDNLYMKVESATDSNPYPDEVINHSAEVLNQYFSLLCEISSEYPDWEKGFILHNNGFNVFSRLLLEFLKFNKGKWNKTEAKNLFNDPLKLYFSQKFEKIKDLRIGTSNEASRSNMALELMEYINQKNEDFGRAFIKDAKKREKSEFVKTEPYQVMKELETELRSFIKGQLESETNWWKSTIPEDVQIRVEERIKKKEHPLPWVKEGEYQDKLVFVDFPDYIKIINKNWNNKFLKVFNNFPIQMKLKELESVRNDIAHFRSLDSTHFSKLKLYSTEIKSFITAPRAEKS
jgi:DNA sulfur modification protein DndB